MCAGDRRCKSISKVSAYLAGEHLISNNTSRTVNSDLITTRASNRRLLLFLLHSPLADSQGQNDQWSGRRRSLDRFPAADLGKGEFAWEGLFIVTVVVQKSSDMLASGNRRGRDPGPVHRRTGRRVRHDHQLGASVRFRKSPRTSHHSEADFVNEGPANSPMHLVASHPLR